MLPFPAVRDAVLGVAVAGLALVAGASGIGPSGPAGRLDAGAVLLACLTAGALGVRRRFPVPALLASNGIVAAWFLLDYPGRLITVAALICCYTVAAERGSWWGAGAWLVTGAVSVLVVRGPLDGAWLDDRAVNALSLELAAVALGAAVHYHRAHAERLAEERVAQTRLRVAEERLEIARELHDVIGHSMAAISVHAGVAVHVMDRKPDEAARALTTIKTVSDEGLAEVQALLGVLRGDGTASAGGLDRLDPLLDITRALGTPVQVTVAGERRPLPPRVDLAAFRIIQESLTNARRHADPTRITLRLTYGDGVLELVIRNDGAHMDALPSPVGGTGIEGMRSRALALGGTLTVEWSDGWFEVRGVLPEHP